MFKKTHQAQRGSARRRAVSLLTGLSFVVLSVTGGIAFIRPFELGVIGLHALMGFVFVGLIACHVVNNQRHLSSYLRSRTLAWTLVTMVGLSLLFWWQPRPVKKILSWSGNLGPAQERFQMVEEEMIFEYSPSDEYKMRLTVKTGDSYHLDNPPHVAIWLENQGGYHIKTLLAPKDASETPYWWFKHVGWEKARREKLEEVDVVSSPTPNGSFDPADYILPARSKESTPYSLLLEINQRGDGQPSLVHAVTIDNSLPKTYQVLELQGYPKKSEDSEKGKETWGLYYVDQNFTSALDLIDSGVLKIQRAGKSK